MIPLLSIQNPPTKQGVLRLEVPPGRLRRLPMDGQERLLRALQRPPPRHGRRWLLRLSGAVPRRALGGGGACVSVCVCVCTDGWIDRRFLEVLDLPDAVPTHNPLKPNP